MVAIFAAGALVEAIAGTGTASFSGAASLIATFLIGLLFSIIGIGVFGDLTIDETTDLSRDFAVVSFVGADFANSTFTPFDFFGTLLLATGLVGTLTVLFFAISFGMAILG